MGLFGSKEDGFLIDLFKKKKEEQSTSGSSVPTYSGFLKNLKGKKKKEQLSFRRQTLPPERVYTNILNSEPFLELREQQEDDVVVGYGFRLTLNLDREKCVQSATDGNASLKTLHAGTIILDEEDARKLTVEWTKLVFLSTKRLISNFYDLPIGVRMALVELAYYRGQSVFEKNPQIREFLEVRNYDGLYKFICTFKPNARYKRVAELIKIKS